MVTVRLNGRLGNQLFQYAFAIALSKRFKVFYVIDDSSVSDSVRKYFVAISFLNNKYVRRVLRGYYDNKRLLPVEQDGFEIDIDVSSCLLDNRYYNGYFQSEEFIKNISNSLKEIFIVKPEYKKDFSDKFSHLFLRSKILAIHCRVGDYVNWGANVLGGNNLVLPEIYYKNAIKCINDIDLYEVVVVTDDILASEKIFSFLDKKSITLNSEIIDFQILMNADKLIISNSTFAWWAAYLNIKEAQVFVPEYWLGFKVKKEFLINIIPSRFTKISF